MIGIVLFVVIIFLPPFVFGVLGYAEDKPITEYERQKKQNEADVQYYLSHENDPDKSNLDKERMENGASMSQLQAAVDACLKLNHNTEWNDDYSCSQSRVRSENYIEKQHGTSSRITFEDACNVYNQEMDEAYKRNFGYIDPSGAYRRWGETFVDYKGNWCSWGGSFYDKELNYRRWGDAFIDGRGNWGSLEHGFYDAVGNWIRGYIS